MVEPKKLASDIYEKVKAHKIIDFNNCLTRLRIKFDKNDLPDINEIKKIVGVINVVKIGSEYQIILGPGIVDKVSAEMKNIVTNTQTSESVVKQTQPLSTNTQNCDTQSSNQKTFDDNKKRFKNNFISQTLSRFAKIFSPLIPAFVGAGILAGIACIIQIAAGITQDPSKNPAAEQ